MRRASPPSAATSYQRSKSREGPVRAACDPAMTVRFEPHPTPDGLGWPGGWCQVTDEEDLSVEAVGVVGVGGQVDEGARLAGADTTV